MKKVKLETQTLLQKGDKFSLFNEDKPSYEIIEETTLRIFTVKRLSSGIIDKNQQIPDPSGDSFCWKFIEEEE